MDNVLLIEEGWMLFCIAIGIALLLLLFLDGMGDHLETKDGSMRKFTFTDLELPSNPMDIPNIINGIYRLPNPAKHTKVEKAIKRILYLDFLLTPAIYGAIFLLCMQVAGNFEAGSSGRNFYSILAFSQVLAWICGIIENVLLLSRIKPNLQPMKKYLHNIFVALVWAKWGLGLIGVVVATMMLFYFGMKGAYRLDSVPFFVISVLEIVLFLGARSFLKKRRLTPDLLANR